MSNELQFSAVRDLIIEAIEGDEQPDGISYKGWCPAHLDKREGGNKSLLYYANPSLKHGFRCLSHSCSDDDIKKALTAKGVDFSSKSKQEPGPTKKASAREKTEDEVLYPMPDPVIPENQRKSNDIIYEYTMPDGRIAFLVHRYIDDVGHKQVRPFFAKKKTNEEGISSFTVEAVAPPKINRPLYNLFGLANAKGKKPVLMVEGEKTAEFARKLLPGYVVMTWSGGTSALSMSDWSSLKGLSTEIFLWPDNDDAGIEAMQQVAAYAKEAGYKGTGFKLIFDKVLQNKAGAWDLADLVEDEHQWMYKMLDKAKDYKPTALARLSEDMQEIVKEFDKKYRKINYKKTIGIVELDIKHDPEGNLLYTIYSNKSAFYDDVTETIKTMMNDKIKFSKKAEIWFDNTKTQTINKEVFDPSTKEVLVKNENVLALNLFTGFIALEEPTDSLEHSELKDLVLNTILPALLPTEKERVYFLNYIAQMLQEPWKKPYSAVILVGKQGAGKSSLIEIVKALLGLKLVRQPDFTIAFNANMASSIFMYKDEFQINYNDLKAYSKLKDLITAPHYDVTRKGVDPIQLTSYHRWIFSTNLTRSIVLAEGDRRFTVLELSDALLGKKDFWHHFHTVLLKDQYQLAVLRKYLIKIFKLNVDLTQPLHTRAKESMLEIQDPIVNWFYQVVQNQTLPSIVYDLQRFGQDEEFCRTPFKIATWVLFEAARSEGIRTTLNRFTRALRAALITTGTINDNRATCEIYRRGAIELTKRQEAVYILGTEIEMRKQLETWAGKELFWPNDILLPVNVIKADFGKKEKEEMPF